MNILQLFKPVTSIVIDFETCMCGGIVTISNNGLVQCSINMRDLYAVEQALMARYQVFFFSRYADIYFPVTTTALPLFIVNESDRKEKLNQLYIDGIVDLSTTLYLGSDIPDVAAMQLAGFACAASDAPYEVKTNAQYISSAAAGNGVVRDVVEKVLKINNQWNM